MVRLARLMMSDVNGIQLTRRKSEKKNINGKIVRVMLMPKKKLTGFILIKMSRSVMRKVAASFIKPAKKQI